MAVSDRLLPKPKSSRALDGSFELPQAIKISIDERASDRTRETARLFEEDLRALTGREVAVKQDGGSDAHVSLKVQDGGSPQGYRLTVKPDGVLAAGFGEPGLYYATRTLLQLIDGGRIPCCEIEDAPDYAHRMVMLDVARENSCNPDHLKRVIDALANHKVNMFHLYFENYFQFAKHPKVSPPRVMTPAQARELDDYARARFVELVPQVNCLAHLQDALCVEEYKRFSEDPNAPWEICTLSPESVEFVKDLVREVAACFRSGYFHMGGDESSQMGACPKCAERIKQDGGKHQLFAEHYTRMGEFIKSLGKRPMMWGDKLLEHRGTAEAMPKDIIIFDWHYGETTVETVRYFTSQGFDVFVCPAMSGFGRLAAPYRHATSNIHKFISEGAECGVMGECTCAWEIRLGHVLYNDYWGILLSADRSWNVAGCELGDYEKRFCKAFFGLDDLRPIDYYKELSDGYASIFEPDIPRSSWLAFSSWPRAESEACQAKVTAGMLAASDTKLEALEKMLTDLRASVTKNAGALEFADVPAHSAHTLLVRLANTRDAGRLVDQAREDRKTDPKAADAKLLRAIALLEELDKEVRWFEPRFKALVDRCGGSELDLQRVARLREDISTRIAEARKLQSTAQ